MKGIKNIIINGCEFESSPLCPPPLPGVYLISVFSPKTHKRLIVYIGCSKNIQERVCTKNHPYLRVYRRLKDFWVITETFITNNYSQLEVDAIIQLKPVLNIRHNG